MGELHHEPFQFAFQGSRVTSDAGFILVRELDERLGLETLISEAAGYSGRRNLVVQRRSRGIKVLIPGARMDPSHVRE